MNLEQTINDLMRISDSIWALTEVEISEHEKFRMQIEQISFEMYCHANELKELKKLLKVTAEEK